MDIEAEAKRRQKLIIVACIAFLLFSIFAIVMAIIDAQKTAKIEVLVAPSFAKVEIDHTKLKTSGTSKYYPGEYTVTISADGFESTETTLNLEKDQTATLYLYLQPTTENYNFYLENKTESNLVQRINDLRTQASNNAYINKYPITEVLPINIVEQNREKNEWTEFHINYGQYENCKTEFCIKISDYTGGNQERALNIIREKGFNPDDYEIIYEYTPIKPIDQSTIDQIHQHYGIN